MTIEDKVKDILSEAELVGKELEDQKTAVIVEEKKKDEDEDKKEGDDASEKKGDDEVKTNLKESIDNLLNGETLTEEFKEKAAVVFEAVVTERVGVEVKKAQSLMETKQVEMLEETKVAITEKLDNYLDYLAEQFVEQNQVAVEANIKVQLAESLFAGIKGVLVEQNVEVSADKSNLFESLEQKNTTLEEQNGKLLADRQTLQEQLETLQREKILAEATASLTDIEKERLTTLVECLEYVDVESFAKKVKILQEQLSTQKPAAAELQTGLLPEGQLNENKEQQPAIDPTVAAVVEHMRRTKR